MASLPLLSRSFACCASSSAACAFLPLPLPLTTRVRCLPPARPLCFAFHKLESLSPSQTIYSKDHVQVVENINKANSPTHSQRLIASVAVCASLFMVDAPAFADTGIFDPELVESVLIWGAFAFIYFLVIPLIVFNYLRLRWYKRNLPEALFQFLLVFLFFPGMLLLAPFINFRRLPRNDAKEPWDDVRSP